MVWRIILSGSVHTHTHTHTHIYRLCSGPLETTGWSLPCPQKGIYTSKNNEYNVDVKCCHITQSISSLQCCEWISITDLTGTYACVCMPKYLWDEGFKETFQVLKQQPFRCPPYWSHWGNESTFLSKSWFCRQVSAAACRARLWAPVTVPCWRNHACTSVTDRHIKPCRLLKGAKRFVWNFSVD